jgi:Ion channel
MGRPEPAGRYGLLLLLLIATYLLSASSLSTLAADLQTILFLGVLWLVHRTAGASPRVVRASAAVALIGTAAAIAAALSHTRGGEGAADIWKGLILLLTAVLIVRRVLARPTVSIQSIYGALSAYLIVGLMYAAFYAAIQHLGSGDFFANHRPADTQALQYFSFTTLTTLGYGDFTAAGNGGRALAVIEALTGQVFLATLVARLVAGFRVPGEQAAALSRRRWPPGNVRRGPGPSYRRRPPRSTGSAARPAAEASRGRRNAPRPGGPGASS